MSDESLADVKAHLKDTNAWLRLLYMLLFGIIYSVAEVVLLAVVVFQFLFVLFGGSRNERLLSLGGQLSTFIYQLLRYLTYNSDIRPYPFGDWPAAEEGGETAESSAFRQAGAARTEPAAAGAKSKGAAETTAKPAAEKAAKSVRKPAAKKKSEPRDTAAGAGDSAAEEKK